MSPTEIEIVDDVVVRAKAEGRAGGDPGPGPAVLAEDDRRRVAGAGELQLSMTRVDDSVEDGREGVGTGALVVDREPVEHGVR